MSFSTTTETVTATAVVVPEYFNEIASSIVSASSKTLEFIKTLPGGEILIRYIVYSYQDDPYRSLFELLLLIFAITYFLKSKSSYSKKDYVKLSAKEIDELVSDWQPDSLVIPVSQKEEWELEDTAVLVDESKTHTRILGPSEGESIEVLNLASLNFLDLAANPAMKESAIEQLYHSGVGACGPPNFYGTQDVHTRLEEGLAEYFGAEKAILYAQDFVTAQSVIPCFLKRGDIAVVDNGVKISIQKAVRIARCEVYWYDHNDMNSLENVLKDLNEALKNEELTRRFIITESLFENSGDVPDLKKIIEIKQEYKYRLILEESRSLGVLGKTGRGLVEHFGVSRKDIDVTIGSLSQAFGSAGGFCIGDAPMVNHQKIQSNAYVFSAALPPYCAKIGSTALQLIQDSTTKDGSSVIVTTLQKNVAKFHSLLSSNKSLAKYVEVVSSPISPTIHLRLAPKLRASLKLPESYGGQGSKIMTAVEKGLEQEFFDEDYNLENYLLQTIINKLIKSGILITRSHRIIHHEILPIVPELLINVNSGVSTSEIETASQTIVTDISSVLSKMTLKKFDSLL